jgi:nucleoside-diphosphate-sugar epimerase
LKNILVTGINGFVGRNIVKYFGNNKHYHLIGTDLADNYLHNSCARENFSYCKLDCKNFEKVRSFFDDKKIDVIVHLAGILSKEEDPQIHEEMLDVNFKSTAILLEFARKQNSHFIFTSTAMVYGDCQGPFHETMKLNPGNYYALTKSLAEDIILYFNKIFNLNYTIFRPAILYGSGQTGNSFIPSLVRTLKADQEFEMTKGEQTRDFVFIDDFMEAIKLAIDKQIDGIFNIGTGTGIQIKEIAELVAQKLEADDKLILGALPYRDNEIWNYALSYEHIKNSLGWQPRTNIEQGIDKLLKFKLPNEK